MVPHVYSLFPYYSWPRAIGGASRGILEGAFSLKCCIMLVGVVVVGWLRGI